MNACINLLLVEFLWAICWSLGTQDQKSTEARKVMNQRYHVTDQGHLEYYLGVEVTQPDSNTLKLHQAGYINKILGAFNMSECASVSTPLPLNINLSLLDCPDEVDSKLQAEYRVMVGTLMYLLQWTRPDLGFTVKSLSRYLHKSGVKHMQAATHLF